MGLSMDERLASARAVLGSTPVKKPYDRTSDLRALREDQRRASGCDGKRAYPKMFDAKFAATLISGTEPYRCAFCHRWHIGTPR